MKEWENCYFYSLQKGFFQSKTYTVKTVDPWYTFFAPLNFISSAYYSFSLFQSLRVFVVERLLCVLFQSF